MDNKVTFHTNINCETCYGKVEKTFEGKNLYKDFKVDFANPKKPATFTLNEGVKTDQIKKLINEAGYKAEVVEETNFMRKLFNRK